MRNSAKLFLVFDDDESFRIRFLIDLGIEGNPRIISRNLIFPLFSVITGNVVRIPSRKGIPFFDLAVVRKTNDRATHDVIGLQLYDRPSRGIEMCRSYSTRQTFCPASPPPEGRRSGRSPWLLP